MCMQARGEDRMDVELHIFALHAVGLIHVVKFMFMCTDCIFSVGY